MLTMSLTPIPFHPDTSTGTSDTTTTSIRPHTTTPAAVPTPDVDGLGATVLVGITALTLMLMAGLLYLFSQR